MLPGVFLIAQSHDRSDSWRAVYGTQGASGYANRLWLKALYRKFVAECRSGMPPVVSQRTKNVAEVVTKISKKKQANANDVGMEVDVVTRSVVKLDAVLNHVASDLGEGHKMGSEEKVLLGLMHKLISHSTERTGRRQLNLHLPSLFPSIL